MMNKWYTEIESFLSLTDNQLLALCIYGEARGESVAGQIAVLNVIMNRASSRYRFYKDKTIKKNQGPLHAVILKQFQFSCFLFSDPNYKNLINLSELMKQNMESGIILKEIKSICKVKEYLIDNTDKSDHYFNKNISIPKWAEKMTHTIVIGNHTFYRYE